MSCRLIDTLHLLPLMTLDQKMRCLAFILQLPSQHGVHWRHGSVVRTSVFGWQTFPDLRLIYGWHVTTSCVKCPLWVNQLGHSAFHPSGDPKMDYMDYEGGDH